MLNPSTENNANYVLEYKGCIIQAEGYADVFQLCKASNNNVSILTKIQTNKKRGLASV